LLLQSVMGVSITGIIPPLVIILGIGAVLSLIAAIRSRKTAQESAMYKED
jgi:sorbitol-specific phosphotransferase system component IIC